MFIIKLHQWLSITVTILIMQILNSKEQILFSQAWHSKKGNVYHEQPKTCLCTIQTSQFLAHRIIPKHPLGKRKKLPLEKRELTLYIMLRAPPFSLKDPFMVALALSKSVLMQRRK